MGEAAKEFPQQPDILRVQNESGKIDVHYSIFYDGLPDEYRLVAERELGETDANREKGLKKLREFMKHENLSASEDILLAVLRPCKYDMKKSETKLKKFLSIRREIINKMCKLDMEKITLILKDEIFSVLPYRDKYGRVVFYSRPTMRFDFYSMEEIEAVSLCFVTYLLTFPLSTVCGFSYIAECKTESLSIFYPVLKSFRMTFLKHTHNAPIRYGRADVLNENFMVQIFCNLLRLILPEKLSKRIHNHGDSYKSLHTIYHPDILVTYFEGKLETVHDILMPKFLEYIRDLREKHKKSGV